MTTHVKSNCTFYIIKSGKGKARTCQVTLYKRDVMVNQDTDYYN